MKIIWQIDAQDIQQVRIFYESYRDDPFVRHRKSRNLAEEKPEISKEKFWFVMVCCLLTTQQRAGPARPVSKFIRIRPFPLSYTRCIEKDDLRQFAQEVLSSFGGIRRFNIVADELVTNLAYLESDLWALALEVVNQLRPEHTPQDERKAAEFIAGRFKGFGPKQSRNLLQSLGLSRYEIPIDSRITRWLNQFGFPVELSAKALADQHYYNFVSEGIQLLCQQAGIHPCLLDAAIFASVDKGLWTEGNVIW